MVTVAEVPHEPKVVAEPCPKPRHTTKVPPRAAAWGQLTMEHFFARPRLASEDEEEEDEPPTKYRCVEATTASNSTAVALDCTKVKTTRRRTRAEVAAAPLRRFRSAHEKVERDHMQGDFIPKNLTLPKPKPAPKPQPKASSSGEHVQLFRMVYDRKKGFRAEHL